MTFTNQKKQCMEKLDKSRKGSIDEDIQTTISLINKSENYYTTSSCSGRIVLIMHEKNYKKYDCDWLISSHTKITLKDAKEALTKIQPNCDIWLKQESPIFHIACKDIDSAKDFLHMVKTLGFKRSGINSYENKLILEIVSTEHMDTIVAKDGQIIVDDKYLEITIKEANKKLNKAKEKLKILEKKIKEFLQQ